MKTGLLLLSMVFGVAGVFGMVFPAELQYAAEAISEPVVSVYGEATKEVAPDIAQIYGEIKIVSKDDAYEGVLGDFETLSAEVEGFENVELKSTYVYQSVSVYDGVIFEKAGLDFCLYIENLENLGEVIQTMLDVENVEIKSITYKLSTDEVYQEVLAEATQNAMDKANSLLNTETLVVGEICEEGYYFSNYAYKDFVSVDDENLIENIEVTARVKVMLGYAEQAEVVEEK